MSQPELTVVIPVYNEEAGLQRLFDRLYPALDALGIAYEIIFVNDGSRDRSAAILAEQFRLRPDVTRVLLFAANFGQHMAIMAAFEHSRADMVITLDADLQNPPEEIGRLVAMLREGYDYVGTIRRQRQDSAFRRYASRLINRIREKTTRIHITDQGCMFRGYARNVVEMVNACREVSTFVPALAYTFARRPVEIEVGHEERAAGESKYSFYSLIRLNFDLMTAFSVVPLQLVSLIGMLLSAVSVATYVIVILERLLTRGLSDGIYVVWDRDILNFFLTGVVLFSLGLIGEYVGRIYQQVRHRPRYVVEALLESGDRTLPSPDSTLSAATTFRAVQPNRRNS